MEALRCRLRAASLVAGSGYVLFYFSERAFWSFLRDDDTALPIVAGWLIYALFAYLLLALIRHFHVAGLWPLVLAGAFFGWLAEGVYAMTLFGDPSLPFPLTIAWTGLAWHGLLSVVVGLFYLRHCLASETVWPSLRLSLALGLFWGFWASGWSQETPPLTTSAFAFFLHSAVATAGLALSQMAITWGRPDAFVPSRLGLGLAAGVVFVFFAGVTVPAVPFAPLVIIPLFALVFLALRQHRLTFSGPDALTAMAGPVSGRAFAPLASIPISATAVYTGLGTANIGLPVHPIVALVSSVVGFAGFLYALQRVARAPARRAEASGFPQS